MVDAATEGPLRILFGSAAKRIPQIPKPLKSPQALALHNQGVGRASPPRRSALRVDPSGTPILLETRDSWAHVNSPQGGQTRRSPRPKVTSVLTRDRDRVTRQTRRTRHATSPSGQGQKGPGRSDGSPSRRHFAQALGGVKGLDTKGQFQNVV